MSKRKGFYRPKTHVKIPSGMHHCFAVDNKLPTLGYYCQIRSLFKNGTIFNCNYRILSQLLKISENSLRTHLPYLIDKGILSFKDGNLVCVGMDKLQVLYPSKKKSLKIQVQSDFKKTKAIVLSIPVVTTLRKQDKFIEIGVKKQLLTRKSETSFISKSDYRFLKKENEAPRDFRYGYKTLGNKRFGEIIGRRSATTVNKYKKLYKEVGILDYQRRFRIIQGSEREKYWDGYNATINGAFFFEGILVKEVTNQYKLGNESFNSYKMDCFIPTFTLSGLTKQSLLVNKLTLF